MRRERKAPPSPSPSLQPKSGGRKVLASATGLGGGGAGALGGERVHDFFSTRGVDADRGLELGVGDAGLCGESKGWSRQAAGPYGPSWVHVWI